MHWLPTSPRLRCRSNFPHTLLLLPSKTKVRVSLVTLFVIGLLFAVCFQVQADETSPSSRTSKVIQRGSHHAVNEHVRVVEKNGQQHSITNRYTTLAAGMHRMVDGNLVEADPAIELHPDGAIAHKTQHRIKFLANINNWEGSIDLKTPDNKRFLSRPLGISYHDRASGQGVLIAELKDSVGTLFPPNKILYADAFTDFKADVEYNNLLGGLQQNLIFRERPLPPTEFGLNNETTVVEFLTEFFEAPEPKKKTQVRNGLDDDSHLDFGAMKIGVGKSFAIGEQKLSFSVQKQWTQLDGRTLLIEQVPYSRIAALLGTLPESPQANNSKPYKHHHIASKKRFLPQRQVASISGKPAIQIASVPMNQKGFVIDYSLMSGSLTNYVFEADKTYLITNALSLYGNTVFEGGTVVKYRQGAGITIYEGTEFRTDAYRPAVFTAWQDDSVGELILGSTNNPTTNASIALYFPGNQALDLKYLRVAYADEAIELFATNAIVSHCQFTKCFIGVWANSSEIGLRNNLFDRCDYALVGVAATITGEHLTVNNGSYLAFDDGASQFRLTNSLLVAVADLGTVNINTTNSNFVWLYSDPGVFQTVGAGSHYLAESSPYRNIGTTNINSSLRSDVSKLTTFPPVVITNDITVNTTFSPVVERDSNIPDLGYHYPPLDFVMGDVRVNGAAVNVLGGAAIGFFARSNSWGGCTLECGAAFNSLGSPENLNRLVWYNTVQEQSQSAWNLVPNYAMPDILTYDNYACAGVTLDCRFTQFSRLDDIGSHIGGGDIGWDGTIRLRDCFFSSGAVFLYAEGNVGQVDAAMTNSFLLRSALYCLMDETMQIDAVNNLFYGGDVYLSGFSVSGVQSAQVRFKDNFFFTNTITSNGPMTVTHSHNAYVTNLPAFSRLGTLATGDVILTSLPTFETGTLGGFYLPTNSLLINAGSQNATNAMLYHFTTTTNNIKEADSTVDIGFHYVATDANGIPIDTDSDGMPDYFEDTNGNSVDDSGEFDWRVFNTRTDFNWIQLFTPLE